MPEDQSSGLHVAYRIALSPHEWEWTQKEQEDMARWIMQALPLYKVPPGEAPADGKYLCVQRDPNSPDSIPHITFGAVEEWNDGVKFWQPTGQPAGFLVEAMLQSGARFYGIPEKQLLGVL